MAPKNQEGLELKGVNFMDMVTQETATKQWQYDELAKKAIQSLKKHQFEALYVKDRLEARSKILELIPPQAKVAITSSVTLRQLGISETLEERGNPVIDHWRQRWSETEALKRYKEALLADVAITGTNALTLNGELINIDTVGNRTAAMHFGPNKVIIVTGVNKIVKDIPAGISRIKNVTTPLIVKALNMPLPCAEVGFCVDCDSPARVCRVTLILERKPLLTDTTVIVVGEDLGY